MNNNIIITEVTVSPSGYSVSANTEIQFKHRCREIMYGIGLGLAWYNSWFNPGDNGFTYAIGLEDTLLLQNAGESDQTLTLFLINEKAKKIPVGICVVSGTYVAHTEDGNTILFKGRNPNLLEIAGLSAMTQSLVS